MLVIRRRLGESVLIGEGVEVSVIEISSTRVKLGILAPPDVLILRKELRLAEAENLAASQGASPAAVDALLRQLRPRTGGKFQSSGIFLS